MKGRKKYLGKCILGIALLLIIVIALLLPHAKAIHKDMKRIKTEEYDTLFMSMYPTEHYKESDFMYYRAMDTLRTDYCIPNGKLVRWYFDQVKAGGNYVEHVYLGVDPEHASKEDIVLLLQENPDVFFEVVLPYPSIEYWTGMKEEKFTDIMQKYQVFVEWILPLENADLYIFGNEEWLVANPANYEDTFSTNEDVSEFLMCNMDYLHPYMVTMEQVGAEMAQYYELYKSYQNRTYPNAEGLEILFLGDSIIGNYTDTLSIPKVVAGHTGAEAYNLGCGGSTAADSTESIPSLTMIADALLEGKMNGIPQDTAYYGELLRYKEEGDKEAPKMFVINYGLNDYFQGLPLHSEEPYDTTTYEGALISVVEKIKKYYPEAQILLMSPHFTNGLNFGKDKSSEVGGTLADYAAVVLEVAEEMDVDVLDNFGKMGITEENWRMYVPDGTHPNEMTRYLFGERIIEKIAYKKAGK